MNICLLFFTQARESFPHSYVNIWFKPSANGLVWSSSRAIGLMWICGTNTLFLERQVPRKEEEASSGAYEHSERPVTVTDLSLRPEKASTETV